MLTAIFIQGMSLSNLAIAVVILAGIAALVFLCLKQLGIGIPPWVQQAFWIVIVVVVIVMAIRFLAGL